jgi:hypothetical protein
MTVLSNPSLLDDLAIALLIVGFVGQVSPFFFPPDRPRLERSLALLFTVMVGAGVALAWQADRLRAADRDLTPAQEAALAQAVRAHPGLTYEVYTTHRNPEALALARKIAAAVQAGSGTAPAFVDDMANPQDGVTLGTRTREVAAGQAVPAIGRALMAARIATISDDVPELDDARMRIVVGRKP